MRLHVVYRTSGGENAKPRPPFYSKLLALCSVLRAAREVTGAELVFMTDGAIPDDRLRLMARHGEVVPSRRGPPRSSHVGFVESYLAALDVPRERGWPADDLVYHVEDDYLHRPEALAALVAAAEGIPQASYLALYGSILYHDAGSYRPEGRLWLRAYSTTSTFASRVGTLAEDRSIHRLGVYLPGVDTQICRAYRGVQPLSVLDVLAGLRGEIGDDAPFRWRWKLAAIATAMKALALRRALRPHVLVAPAECLAVHMELPYLGTGADRVDWPSVAADVRAWAAEELGVAVP